MSSSLRSGSVSWNSRRHSGLAREISLRGRPGLPDAQKPDPVEAHPGEAIELGIGYVVQRGGRPELARQLRQPDTRVDLIERGIVWCFHIRWAGLSIARSTLRIATTAEAGGAAVFVDTDADSPGVDFF